MRKMIYRAEYGLRPNQRHDFAMAHALTIPPGMIYSYIPKNACTSLRCAAGTANGLGSDYTVFGNVQASIQATLPEVRDAQYTFVLLRCPYRRLASMFLDKSIREQWRFDRVRGRLDRLLRRGVGHLTFRTFVGLLEAPGAMMAEHHWAPQTAFLLFEDYDDYFSVEAADAAFSALRSRFPLEDTRTLSGHSTLGLTKIDGDFSDMPARKIRDLNRNGRIPSYRSMYDEDIRKRVADLYSADLALYRAMIGPALFDS
jgi:hypothetical protein